MFLKKAPKILDQDYNLTEQTSYHAWKFCRNRPPKLEDLVVNKKNKLESLGG